MKILTACVFIMSCIFSNIALAVDQKSERSNPSNVNSSGKNINTATDNTNTKEVNSAKWEKVFEDKTMQVYVDINNVKWDGDNVTFWKMLDLNKKIKGGALSLWSNDMHMCGKKLLRREWIVHFSGQYGSGKQLKDKATEYEIERIKTGSMDDAVDEYVCRLKH